MRRWGSDVDPSSTAGMGAGRRSSFSRTSGGGSRSKRLSRRRRRTRRKVVGWSVAALALLAIGCIAWVGIRGWMAKTELEAAIPLASQVQDDIQSGDVEQAKSSASALVDRSRRAEQLTSDPIWRVAELIPVVGSNLSAVRVAAEITDSVSREAVFPLVSDLSSIGVDSFKPVGGAVDLAPLIAAQPSVSAARLVLEQAEMKARAISTDSTLPPVSAAVDKLQASVGEANALLQGLDRAVTLLPRMLGGGGDRSYLLAFQNPAEIRAGGGITSALAEVDTSAGTVRLGQQASSGDFPKEAAPVLALAPELTALYGDRAGRFVQNTTLVPNFQITGQVAAKLWEAKFGTQVDGVVSFDPVALSYLLEATGPVVLPTSQVELSSSNAVQFLLSDVYSQFPDTDVQDAVFAEAARSIFDRVSAGDVSPARLIRALAIASNEGRFKIWSSHADDQELLAGTIFAGELPITTKDHTGIGVYFNDSTGAKMSYYLDSRVDVASAQCRSDGRQIVRISVTLSNSAPADAADTLPAYVTGAGQFGVTPGHASTIVYFYGPEETVPDQPVEVLQMDPGSVSGESFSGRDGGHTVVGFPTNLAPGESQTMAVEFLAQSGDPVNVQATITPGVRPTVYSAETNRSFAGCDIG